jgi:DNA-binding beta-propeller fold protein YncE
MKFVRALAAIALSSSLTWSLASAYAQAPLTPENTIPLPGVHGRIDHMAFDPQHNRLFVAALGTDALAVVDVNSGAVVHTITGLAEPQGIGYDPDHNRLWVANGRDGSVRIYDAQTFQPLRTVPLGEDADNIRRDPATGHMLVGYGAGAIATFDADGKQLANIKLDAHPESFQLEPSGPRMFVNLPDSHKIAVLDRNKSAVVATWSTDDARANFPMALDAADNRLFVVCRHPAVLLVLDDASGQIVQKLPTVGDSDDLFYDAALKRIYVSGGEGAISVYQQQDRDHYSQIAHVKTTPGARTSLFVPTLNRLFLAVREQAGKPAAIQILKTSK